MSRKERLAQARRRRRLARFHGALESVLWIGGAGAFLAVITGGFFGLR